MVEKLLFLGSISNCLKYHHWKLFAMVSLKIRYSEAPTGKLSLKYHQPGLSCPPGERLLLWGHSLFWGSHFYLFWLDVQRLDLLNVSPSPERERLILRISQV